MPISEGLRPASCASASSFLAFLGEFFGCDPVRQPAVGVRDDAFQDFRRGTADIDRRARLLLWFRERPDRREVKKFPVILRLFLRPAQLHDVEGFARLCPAACEIAAHEFRLFLQPAGTDPEDEAPAAV